MPLPRSCLCLGFLPSLLYLLCFYLVHACVWVFRFSAFLLWVCLLLLLSYLSASCMSFRRLVNISFQNSSLAIYTNIDVSNRWLQPPLCPPAPLRPPDPLHPPAPLRPPAPLCPPAPLRLPDPLRLPAPLRPPASRHPSTFLRLLALVPPLILVC